MTDAHCHVSCGDPTVREFLIGRDFVGVHPWDAEDADFGELERRIRDALSSRTPTGVGEIGLDRLKSREISPRMREVFEVQLKLALEFRRPVVLHGAKCWGQVVKTVQFHCPPPPLYPTFLFHGFSRSDGLIPDIVALNGYVSVGPAVLNDHAVNYRALVKEIPLERLLVETDRTVENASSCPSVCDVLAKTAELRGLSASDLERITDANASVFLSGIHRSPLTANR